MEKFGAWPSIKGAGLKEGESQEKPTHTWKKFWGKKPQFGDFKGEIGGVVKAGWAGLERQDQTSPSH